MPKLAASIVLYNHDQTEVCELIQTLVDSICDKIYLIDNSPNAIFNYRSFDSEKIHYVSTPNNPGYGAGHNLGIKQSIIGDYNYHLVVNPDIRLEKEILKDLVHYMDNENEVGQIMPKVLNSDGSIQFVCKLLPTPFDLIIRRFLPKSFFEKKQELFQLKFTGYDKQMNIPFLSGCFMFFRVTALKDVGAFDERFFMYGEDIDLTRRIHNKYKTLFYPNVTVIHEHGKGSYKSFKLLKIHIKNIIKYFNKWGWFFDSERRNINRKTVKRLLNLD